MLRTVQITVPSDQTDDLVAQLRTLDGLLSLRVQRDVSVQPPGDVVSAEVAGRSLQDLMRMLDAREVGRRSGTSIALSEPSSLVSLPSASLITIDSHESTWEEMELIITKESSMTIDMLAVMAISGALAALGLITSAVHYVIAAMVIAPGFEPLVRIPLGVVTQSRAWRRGLVNAVQAYAALILGAMVTALVLRALGLPLIGQGGAYLAPGVLVSFWTSITATSVLVSAVAALAGAVLIAIHRSVLTAGVMIALALIPAATIIGLGLVAADISLAAQGLLRWALDVALVISGAALVFHLKQARVHRRRMLL